MDLPEAVDSDSDEQHSAQPTGLGAAIELGNVRTQQDGGHRRRQVYLNAALWFGNGQPSAALVAAFKRAHSAAAKAVGMDREALAAEQVLFTLPSLWGVPDDAGEGQAVRVAARRAIQSAAAGAPLQAPLCRRTSAGASLQAHLCRRTSHALQLDFGSACMSTAVYLGVSSLSQSDVQACYKAANRFLDRLGLGRFKLGDAVPGSAALLPSSLPPASREVGQLLAFMLNVPERCNAWVYSTQSDSAFPASLSLDLDSGVLLSALSNIIEHPQPCQLTKSRTVCFWCGAPPVARGVQLFECASCRRVAYCGQKCFAADWKGAHAYECGGRGGVEPPDLGMTRKLTEVDRTESLWITVARKGRLKVECGVMQPCRLEPSRPPGTFIIPHCFRVWLGDDIV